jgi:hypothetical protein
MGRFALLLTVYGFLMTSAKTDVPYTPDRTNQAEA